MSLLSSIQLANNALRAQQIGMQVVGQNIANASTPEYVREEVNFAASPTQRIGSLLLGLGVQVEGVVRKIDRFLEGRLRGATSDRAAAVTEEQVHLQLEVLIGELSDTDLSTSLNDFFGSVAEVLNQPESVVVRNLAVLQGESLTGDINRMMGRARQLRSDLNQRVINMADDVNRFIQEIHRLNSQIVEFEGGAAASSDAVGLRDQRDAALAQLSELIDVRAVEQSNGLVNVFNGDDFLIFESTVRHVTVELSINRGLTVGDLRIMEIGSPLQSSSGELGGLIAGRDQVLGGFIDDLDQFAQTLAFEFNRVFSSGQGLKGYQQLTSEFAVDDVSSVLNAAGLAFTPEHGSLQVLVYNKQTGTTQTNDIDVDLNGLGNNDDTLTSLVAALDAIDGISASILPDRRVSITSDSPDQDFAFANDTSGVLAALGINTFFSGSTAQGIGVTQAVLNDPALFAASRGGIGEDTDNAVMLAAFLDQPLASLNGDTLANLYDRITVGVTQASSVAGAVAEGFRIFEQTLRGQKLGVSGVSLDEETVRLMAFQRAFQATARYISTLNELLDTLVNL